MKKSSVIAAMALMILTLAGCSTYQIFPGQYVVLEGFHAIRAVEQCSRWAPKPVEGGWMPSKEQIQTLEGKLGKLNGSRSTECCIPGLRLKDINRYFRQYVGIVYQGKKLIYINAIPISDLVGRDDCSACLSARQGPVHICDGGDCCWGAIYDPSTRQFFGLAFNGNA